MHLYLGPCQQYLSYGGTFLASEQNSVQWGKSYPCSAIFFDKIAQAERLTPLSSSTAMQENHFVKR